MYYGFYPGMYYGFYPGMSGFSPWGGPVGPIYGMSGYPYPGAYSPYGGMGQTPYPPPGGPGMPGMSPFGPPMTPEQEIEFLRDQTRILKEQMDQIDARIQELEKGGR